MINNFLSENEQIIGVDISKNDVKIVELNKQGTMYELKRVHAAKLNQYENVTQYKHFVAQAIQTIMEQNKIDIKNVSLSIPAEHSIFKVISLPLLTSNELNNAIDNNSIWESIMPSENIEEYSVYYSVIEKKVQEGMMDILLVASKFTDIEKYTKIISQAKLTPMVIDIEVLAIKQLLEQEITSGKKVILSLEKDNTYLAIYDQKIPYISDIFISDSDWESIEDVAISQGIFTRVALQINQLIEQYKHDHPEVAIEGVYVISSFDLDSEYLSIMNENIKEIDVKPFDPFKNIIVPEHLKEKVNLLDHKNKFAIVIALAMKQINVLKYYQKASGLDGVNLLPNIAAIKTKKRVRILFKVSSIILAIILIGGGSYFYDYNTKEQKKLDKQLIGFDVLKKELTLKTKKVSDMKKQKTELELLLKNGLDLKSNKVFLYDILEHISNVIPMGIKIEEIELKESNLLKIQGVSLNDRNIVTMIGAISKSKLITKVLLENIALDNKGNKKFQIKCYFNKGGN
jgi:type IV pilus assembly protein PilM